MNDDLEMRVLRLERSAGRWKAVALSLAGMLAGAAGLACARQPAAVAAVAPAPAGEIVATRIVLKDRAGAERAILSVDEESDEKGVWLEMFAGGKRIVNFGGYKPGVADLQFFGPDNDAMPRLEIGVSPEPAIGYFDSKLNRASIYLGDDGLEILTRDASTRDRSIISGGKLITP